MKLTKLWLAMAAAGTLLATGCAVNTYHTSTGAADPMLFNPVKKYHIVNGETVNLKAFDDNGKIPAIELNLLAQSLKNQPGTAFGAFWTQSAPALDNAYGYLNIRSDDTTALQLASRNSNPILFEETTGSIPVQVKTVLVLSPDSISGGWMTAYLLSVTMAPMKKYNCGAIVVAVLDKEGKTIGTKTVALCHAQWVSCLFPTALFAGGDFCASAGGFAAMDDQEKDMQNKIVIQAATQVLTGKGDSYADPSWNNIRAAVVEALAVGNTDAAEKLLKNAKQQNIGGSERQSMADLL